MKKLFFISFAMVTVTCFFSLRPHPYITGGVLQKKVTKITEGKSIDPKAKERIVISNKNEMIETTLNAAKSVYEYETELAGLSFKEINFKLSQSNQIIDDKKIFQRANSIEGLSPQETKELIEIMRERQALNKIKLNRQLEQIKEKYL